MKKETVRKKEEIHSGKKNHNKSGKYEGKEKKGCQDGRKEGRGRER